MTSLQIGTAIYNILSNDTDVSALVEDKIFPIVVDDEKTSFPFIVYKRTGTEPLSNKDAYIEHAKVDILIAANTYPQSIAVAEAVRKALEGYTGLVNGFVINDIILNYASEDYTDGVFTQSLQWKIEFNT